MDWLEASVYTKALKGVILKLPKMLRHTFLVG